MHALLEKVGAGKMVIVASDITTATKAQFPEHARLYFNLPEMVHPGIFVRASMAVPGFFCTCRGRFDLILVRLTFIRSFSMFTLVMPPLVSCFVIQSSKYLPLCRPCRVIALYMQSTTGVM